MFLYTTPLKHYPQMSALFTIILTSILLAAFDEPEYPVTPEDDISSENTLGNWYTLGRVSGNRTYLNMLSPYIDRDNGGLLLADFFHTTGGNNRLEGGISFLSLLGFTENGFLFIGMLPEGDLIFAPTPGNRISLTMTSPTVSFLLTDQFAHSGFEDDFMLNGQLGWSFLSRKGEIKVLPDQYEMAFFLGPQLNRGQVKTSLYLGNPIRDAAAQLEDGDVFNLYATATVGILNNLSITGSISSSEQNPFNAAMNSTPFNGYSDYVPFRYEYDHEIATAFLEYRLPSFAARGGYLHKWLTMLGNMYLGTDLQTRYFFLDATYILGPHISSLAQVNGNFDGYFNQIPAKHQFRARATTIFDITPYNDILMYPDHTVQNDICYGVTSFLAIGQQGTYIFRQSDLATKNPYIRDISLTFTLSNIPLRTRGPKAVSKFEYQFGYWPRAGEFRVDGSYQLPLHDYIPRSSYPPGSVLERINSSSIQYTNSRFSIPSAFTFNQGRSNTPPLAAPDIALSCAVGLSETIILSNSFSFRTDEVSIYYDNIYNWNANTTNHLWADQISIHLGNPEQYLHSLSILLAGQSDYRVRDLYKFDFLFSYTYTAGF